jgi:hypothetical protein
MEVLVANEVANTIENREIVCSIEDCLAAQYNPRLSVKVRTFTGDAYLTWKNRQRLAKSQLLPKFGSLE